MNKKATPKKKTMTYEQRKIRNQQVIMGIIGIILILVMVLTLVVR